MNNIKVSVIVPVYNQEKYIRQCLESICSQTLKDIEIIVINDGSTDNSLSIINELAKNDSRIIIINKKNSGYGASINIGISKATGEYIGIVESDDSIVPEMYEELYNLSANGRIELVKGNFYNSYDTPIGIIGTPDIDRNNVIPEIECLTIDNPKIFDGHPSIWSAIYKRSFLLEHNIKLLELPGASWTDNPFFFDTLLSCKSCIYTNKPLYFYRLTNPNSSSNSLTNAILPIYTMIYNLDTIYKYNITNKDIWQYITKRLAAYVSLSYSMVQDEKELDTAIYELAKKIQEKETFFCGAYLPEQFITKYKSIIKPKNKILIYNWTQLNSGRGGGVGVYCKNLASLIINNTLNTDVYFLSSGEIYDSTNKVYIKHVQNTDGLRIQEYEVVNSPVRAPQWQVLNEPEVYLASAELKDTFKNFIDTYGPFNVIHFNNFEGLSLDIFSLKKDYPDTKFIFSIHNYTSICLSGSYYQRHNHCICNPNHTVEDCKKCANSMAILDTISSYYKTAITTLNNNCDIILCVSKKTYDIVVANGLDANKCHISYIGTAVASNQMPPQQNNTNTLKLLFLGNRLDYEEKGYPFLLDALSQLDPKYASKIDLKFTTMSPTEETLGLKNKLINFKSVEFICGGYRFENLVNICKGCDLSIIPPVWEDNLPQIAIESIAFGLPILVSDTGGASELCRNALFIFKAGNVSDLLVRLKYFVDNKYALTLFWGSYKKLVTLNDHWKDLNTNYYKLKN